MLSLKQPAMTPLHYVSLMAEHLNLSHISFVIFYLQSYLRRFSAPTFDCFEFLFLFFIHQLKFSVSFKSCCSKFRTEEASTRFLALFRLQDLLYSCIFVLRMR